MGFNSREFGDVGRAFQKGGLGGALSTWGGNFAKNASKLFHGEEAYQKKLEEEINADSIRPYEVVTNEEFQQPPSDFPHGQSQPTGVAQSFQPAPTGMEALQQPPSDFPHGQSRPSSVAQPSQPAPTGAPPQTQPQPQVMAGRPPIQNPQKPGNVTGNPAAQPPIGGQSPVDGVDTPWLVGLQNPGADPTAGGFSDDDDALAASKPINQGNTPGAPAPAPRSRYGSRGRTSGGPASAYTPDITNAQTGERRPMPGAAPQQPQQQQQPQQPQPQPQQPGGYNNGDSNRRLFASHWQQGVSRPGSQTGRRGESISDRQGRQQAGLNRRKQQWA